MNFFKMLKNTKKTQKKYKKKYKKNSFIKYLI